MKIVLGLFSPSFYNLAKETQSETYSYAWVKQSRHSYYVPKEFSWFTQNYQEVCWAIDTADEILFDLTNIFLPIVETNEDFITGGEFLYTIKFAFHKTKFFVEGVQLDGELVRAEFLKGEKKKFLELK